MHTIHTMLLVNIVYGALHIIYIKPVNCVIQVKVSDECFWDLYRTTPEVESNTNPENMSCLGLFRLFQFSPSEMFQRILTPQNDT